MRFALFCAVFVQFAVAQTWKIQGTKPGVSLRGISVVTSSIVWASGTGGTVLLTTDGGTTWTTAVVKGAETLDFRGIQGFSAKRAIVMSSGEGAKSTLWQTTDAGVTWSPVFSNPDPKGFFDALAFADSSRGALLGDPVDGHFALFLTIDGGVHWDRIQTPQALHGEGAFAASNSSLVIGHCKDKTDCQIAFASGGVGAARVFRSTNLRDWTVEKTPLRNDEAGAGIFSLRTGSKSLWIAAGGNYTKPKETTGVIAIRSSKEPDASWSVPQGTRPRGYRSSVAYLADRDLWIVTGPSGSEISRDGGQNWTAFDNGAFNALGGTSTKSCWAVGPEGRIAQFMP